MKSHCKCSVSWIAEYLGSSVGKKQVMAVTGLLWVGFLMNHMLGNISLMFSPETFNNVAHFYATHKIIMYGGELLVGTFLLIHVTMAYITYRQNKKARPVPYYMVNRKGSASVASFTMIYTGGIIALFLVLHIYALKYGTTGTVVYDGVEMKDMYTLAATLFADWKFSLFYAVALVAVGLHVSHSLQSAAQTFGLNHSKYWGTIQMLSKVAGLSIGVGNIIITTVMFVKGAR